jgi:hypothetical protein
MYKIEMVSFSSSIRTPHGVIKEFHRENISDSSRFDAMFDSVKDRIIIRVRGHEESCYVVPAASIKFMKLSKASIDDMLGDGVPQDYVGPEREVKTQLSVRRQPIRAD